MLQIVALLLTAYAGNSQYLNNGSDWWSLIGHAGGGGYFDPPYYPTRDRRLPAPDFVILGVDLQAESPIDQAKNRIGMAPVLSRGDASTGRAQICFKSALDDGRYKLIFEEGELDSVVYMI